MNRARGKDCRSPRMESNRRRAVICAENTAGTSALLLVHPVQVPQLHTGVVLTPAWVASSAIRAVMLLRTPHLILGLPLLICLLRMRSVYLSDPNRKEDMICVDFAI